MAHPDVRRHRIGCRSVAICLLSMLFLGGLDNAAAQQPTKIPRIGWLTAATLSSTAARIEAFHQGLRELGYVEGKNIVVEWRSPQSKPDLMPTLAAELVRLKVDIIVTAGGGATRPAKEATKTIPIVMAQDSDPVGNGHVGSLARPGGNITGLSTLAPELSGKRLELLKEIVPKLSRVAVFPTSGGHDYQQTINEINLAAPAIGVRLQHVDIQAGKDIEPGFAAASKERVGAILWMVSGPVYGPHRSQISDLAVKRRLPVMFKEREPMETGGLMFYGVSLTDLDRRSAAYVEKILKGRKPADLPVEQPVKFEFVINLKAAKQIGLTIPPNVLVRADKVIR